MNKKELIETLYRARDINLAIDKEDWHKTRYRKELFSCHAIKHACKHYKHILYVSEWLERIHPGINHNVYMFGKHSAASQQKRFMWLTTLIVGLETGMLDWSLR